MKLRTMFSGIAVATVMAAALSAPAQATESAPEKLQDETDVVYTPVEPTSDEVLIDGQPTDIAVMPGFDASAPAVVVDGTGQPTSVGDVSIVSAGGEISALSLVAPTDIEALAGCGWTNWVAPGTGTYHTSVPGCSVIGVSPDAQVSYSWTVDSLSNGSACLQGRGYKARHLPGGGTTYDEYFGALGCGTSGGGALSLGEVASTKVVKALATSTPVGAAGMFQ